MIASVHLADVGMPAALKLTRAKLAGVDGLRYSAFTIAAPLGGHVLPRPSLGRIGLIATWEDDRAVENFLAGHPVAEQMAGGWHVRLQPKHMYGEWPPLPSAQIDSEPLDADEPAAALTIGRLRLTQTVRFLKASAAAESLAVRSPGLIAATGLAKLPSLVSTFSLWQNTGAMRAYAQGQASPEHRAAVQAHAARPFHHQSGFIRFRPYASQGQWDGRDPLALTASASAEAVGG